jgi:membrane associated rhomboid family serine protease
MRRVSSGGRRFSFGPGLTRAVAWIIGIEVGAFLLYLFVTKSTRAALEYWGVLTPGSLLDGHVWKLATTLLFHRNGLEFFFDMLMLWLFVPVLEQYWGSRRFLWFLGVTSIVGNLVASGVGLLIGDHMQPIAGLSSFVYASIAAYGTAFANQPVQLFGIVPIKGKWLAWGTLAFVSLFVLLEQRWTTGAGHYAAMATAWAMTSGVWTPNIWWLKFRRWRVRRKYQVIDGGARDRESKQRWMN